MQNLLTTPITIAVFQITPFLYLSMFKVNINATGNNYLKIWLKWKWGWCTTYWEKVIMIDYAPFIVEIWSCYKKWNSERCSKGGGGWATQIYEKF